MDRRQLSIHVTINVFNQNKKIFTKRVPFALRRCDHTQHTPQLRHCNPTCEMCFILFPLSFSMKKKQPWCWIKLIVNDIYFWSNNYNYPEEYVMYNKSRAIYFCPNYVIFCLKTFRFFFFFLEAASAALQARALMFVWFYHFFKNK